MEERRFDPAMLAGERFPDWRELYAKQPVESMPWYYPVLDHDLEAAIKSRNLSAGTFLDIGTGPGTQAIELAKRGFTVTGVDLADAAIEKAKALSAEVRWMQDDVLQTKLSEAFDFVFDRGCFHVIAPESRPTYVATLKRLVKPGGAAFIKCFSVEQPGMERGPHRFSRQDIEAIFGADFEIESVADSEYQGPLNPWPKALFVVLRPKA